MIQRYFVVHLHNDYQWHKKKDFFCHFFPPTQTTQPFSSWTPQHCCMVVTFSERYQNTCVIAQWKKPNKPYVTHMCKLNTALCIFSMLNWLLRLSLGAQLVGVWLQWVKLVTFKNRPVNAKVLWQHSVSAERRYAQQKREFVRSIITRRSYKSKEIFFWYVDVQRVYSCLVLT